MWAVRRKRDVTEDNSAQASRVLTLLELIAAQKQRTNVADFPPPVSWVSVSAFHAPLNHPWLPRVQKSRALLYSGMTLTKAREEAWEDFRNFDDEKRRRL
jgi:hypothetical protein